MALDVSTHPSPANISPTNMHVSMGSATMLISRVTASPFFASNEGSFLSFFFRRSWRIASISSSFPGFFVRTAVHSMQCLLQHSCIFRNFWNLHTDNWANGFAFPQVLGLR